MPEFSVNVHRLDPYKNFRYRVMWDGRYVAGMSKMSGLKRTPDMVPHRDGGGPSPTRRSPERPAFEPITLDRGITHDTAFEQWANACHPGSGPGSGSPVQDYRRDLVIEVYNEAGQKVIAYKVHNCQVSEYTAIPDLDANANAVAIEHMKIENEGWERDTSVGEPTEPGIEGK